MGLKRFDYKMNESKKTPIIIAIVVIMILLIGVTVYMTQAKYKVTNSYNILKGQVSNFTTIKEGSLAYDIITQYGGFKNIEEISYELLPQNPEDVDTTEIWLDDETSYWYGTDYSYDSTTQQFSLTGTLVQATRTECVSGTKTCGKYTHQNSEENGTASYVYEIVDMSSNIAQIKSITIANEFTTGTKEGEAGLYRASDDYGTSYYFRGNPTNNYVSLGLDAQYVGCYEEDSGSCTTADYFETEAECLEKYAYCESQSINNSWRIVRINGDGTIRMIYSDTIGEGNYNNSGYNTHVGYMFGTTSDPYTNTNSSAAKEFLDNWYSTNLKEKYEAYIADSIFCNDREVASVSNGTTYYMAKTRVSQSVPKLTCTQQNDRFTVDDVTNGNGALTYPIGLLTFDEYMMAGRSGYSESTVSFLGASYSYWTMSPYEADESNGLVYAGSSSSIPYVTQSGVYPDYRPVINLKADVEFTGDGSIDNPYVITIN